MKTLLLKLLIVSFFLVSCGGGGESSSPKSPVNPVSVNIAPSISEIVVINDSTGSDVLETQDPFTILIKVSDNENDPITGNVVLGDVSVELSRYSGVEDYTHQTTFTLGTEGVHTAVITISDSINSNVITNHNITVIPKAPQNIAPIISTIIGIHEESGTEVLETHEPFIILIKASDNEDDTITGSITLNETSTELFNYTGDDDYTHQASFTIDTKGEHSAIITITDSSNPDVVVNHTLSITPNESDIQTILSGLVTGFIAGGVFEGESILGVSVDELNRTIGYLSRTPLEFDLQHNATPFGQCGVNTPHKLLEVSVDSTEVIVPDLGLIFPLECLTPGQIDKINQKITIPELKENNLDSQKNYIAQNFVLTKNENNEVSIVQTGSGISFEGEVDKITCGGITINEANGHYLLSENKLLENLDVLTSDSSSFELQCQREVMFEGQVESSPLLATITGSLTEIDQTFPTGSIDSVNFTIPYLEGALDQGDICASTTANDNKGVASEVLILNADDGLTDSVKMQFEVSSQKFCASLEGYDGLVHISQSITDIFDNETINISESYLIKKNEAPVFSPDLSDSVSLRINQGIVTLVEHIDVNDPENHEFTLSGDTSIDTSQEVGSYSLTAIATDQYGAATSKSITAELTKNSAPTANISVTSDTFGEDEWLYNGKIRDDNVEVVIGLASNDKDGRVVSSSLKADLGWGDFIDIDNYSSTYRAGVYFVGGKTLRFKYQVTDNEGKPSKVATLEFEVHKNVGPTYTGQTSFTISTGDCINIEKVATDPENDAIRGYFIEGSDWKPCFNTEGDYTLEVTVVDYYGLSGDDTIINISVED